MRKLDVKEIHGYDAAEGLKLVKPDALVRRSSDRLAAMGSAPDCRTRQQIGPEHVTLVRNDAQVLS